ncbi:hypothetical protein ACFC26_40905 [Kitasatospora purpeofusca]|uniref:hypothetical protein n=1 Tax=Kitasatospora purpeofusca TaxID=67352 RepID=UPI0035E27DF0
MSRHLRRTAALVTTGVLLTCGVAFAPSAYAAPAGCGNNIADYTGAAFTLTTSDPSPSYLPKSVTFNSDGTVTDTYGTGSFKIAVSTLDAGGSGTVQVAVPVFGTSPFGEQSLANFVFTPTCLVGTTVRQLNGFGQPNTILIAATLSRPSL